MNQKAPWAWAPWVWDVTQRTCWERWEYDIPACGDLLAWLRLVNAQVASHTVRHTLAGTGVTLRLGACKGGHRNVHLGPEGFSQVHASNARPLCTPMGTYRVNRVVQCSGCQQSNDL
jgi:hypothetical protein